MKKAILDPIDIRILSAVQHNGQLSKSRLAELVNLSQTPCWARLSKLKNAGLIRSYRADIALERITNLSRVFVTVSLSSHRKSESDRFEKRINERDEIVECFATGGGMDYIMKLVTPNLGTFLATMESLISEELGIERYMTYIVTREIKSMPPNLALLASAGQN